MKIVDRAVKKVYRFNCPNFTWSDLRKKTVYEGENTQ